MNGEADAHRYFVIVSPASGGGKGVARAADLLAELRRSGHDVEADLTTSLEHGTELAAAHARPGTTVVAVGGDGLVTAVVNGMAETEGSLMGIVPMGTGNDFARALGITKANALDVLLAGAARTVDLGRLGDRYFTCMASVGLDSRVLEAAAASRWVPGRFVYHYAVLRALLAWTGATFEMTVDGEGSRFTGYSLAVSNAGVYGGGMRMAPDARLDDGLLDVVTIADVSKLRFLAVAPRIFFGTHTRHPAVSVRNGRTVTIDVDGPFTVYADGEPMGPAPATVESRPAALTVLAPPPKSES